MPKFLALEGLRGILAIVVIAGHFGLNTVAGGVGLFVRYNLAVDIFFVISGFVLSHSYYFQQKSFPDFAIARFARLYPLHLFSFVWMALLVWATGTPVDVVSAVETVLVVNNIVTPPSVLPIDYPMWSTSIDLVVSLMLWPVARRAGDSAIVAVLLASVAILVIRPLCFGGDADACVGPVSSGFVRGVAGFLAGVLCYRLVAERPEPFVRLQALVNPALGVLALSTLVPVDSALNPVVCLVAAAFVVGSLAATGRGGVLACRPCVFLGAISYSLYLLHNPVYSTLDLVMPAGAIRGLAGKCLFLAVVLACASAVYFWVELPLKRLLRDWAVRHRGALPIAKARESRGAD